MNKEDKEVKKTKWLSDTILVFVSPIVAYLLLYVYEIGYTNYFGIPIEFISIDISKILSILGGLWGLIFLFISFINLIIILFNGVDNYIVRELKPLIPIYMLSFMMLFLFGLDHWKIMIPSLFVTLLAFAFPLISQKNKSTYKEKLEAQAIIDRETKDIYSILNKLIGKRGMLLILTLLIALNLSFSFGAANAMNKQDFITISSQPDVIVLCKYGDNFICSKIDNINKCITKEFSVVNIYNEQSNMYKIEKFIGYTVDE